MESLVSNSETLLAFVNACLRAAKAPIFCWNQPPPLLEGADFLSMSQKDPGSSEWITLLGLSSRPTLLILNTDGSEFGRIDRHTSGVSLFEEAQELVGAFTREEEILNRYQTEPSTPGVLTEALSLFTIQRKAIEASEVWDEMMRQRIVPTAYIARRVGETAIGRGRFDLAKPLFRHILDSEAPDGERLEAWSRLIWCALTLSETEEAKTLSEGFHPRVIQSERAKAGSRQPH